MTSFRLSVPVDLETLLKFSRNFYSMNNYPFDEEINRESLENLIRNDNLGKIWIIEYNTVPAGYIILTFGYSIEYKGRDAFIDELFIAEEYRGRGIGKAAVEFAVTQAAGLGIKAVHLEVERENNRAKKLYLKLQFEDKGRTLMTKWIGEGDRNS